MTPNAFMRPRTSTASRPRIVAAALALALTSGLVACSANTNPSGDTVGDATGQDAELVALWADFRETVDVPGKPLTVGSLKLKVPAGFTQADVDALARRAVSVLQRSTAPRLSSMDPDDAIDFVYDPQPSLTKFDFERDAIKATQGYPWQLTAASRFPETPSEARAIRVVANAESYDGNLDDGTPSKYLAVTVEAHLVQDVPVTGSEFGGETVPIVSQRAVSASSFRPRGGPDWWPSVRARMSPYGNDGCALLDEPLLVPLTDTDVLRQDLAGLKSTLRSTEVSATSFNAATLTAKDRREMEKRADEYESECADRP